EETGRAVRAGPPGAAKGKEVSMSAFRKYVLLMGVAVLGATATAHADPLPTAAGFGSLGGRTPAIPGALPGSLWYNGDFDGRNGLANERNTAVSQAAVYDNFFATGHGFRVTGVYSDNQITPGTVFTGADFSIRTGVSAGNGGTIVASGTN